MSRPRCLALFRAAAALLALALSSAAHAWWNDDFKQRTRITFNTTAGGVETREALAGIAVPLRLHSGNFDFVAARPDGSDLRVVAGDDKTPLKFAVERWDGANELAVVWVLLPTVAPGSDRNVVYVYAGNPKAGAEPPAAVAGSGGGASFHFADAAGSDAGGELKATAPLVPEPNGIVGPAVRLQGNAIAWPAADRLKAAAGAPYTVTLWAKPDGAAAGTLFRQGPVTLALDGGKLVLRYDTLVLSGGTLPPGAAVQAGFAVAAGKATLLLDGAVVASGDLPAGAPPIDGPVQVGGGFNGLLDELQVATAARSADWLRFARAAQAADAKLVASVLQPKDGGEGGQGGEGGYIGVLVKNLTLDAKIVIGILGAMFAVALWVMVVKALLIRRVDRGNDGFIRGFREHADVLAADGAARHPGSTLARLYDAGVRELAKREVAARRQPLSGASLDAVKAAVDADLVRENHRLNAQMVLLTIAISGGPFLGLLGTVVGVMITFAAIAAAGDVNVNAIAPGIAAALLATVAGLAVAIPALFGYNYLASRIKAISADMQIFVDEFVTRVAESYGAR